MAGVILGPVRYVDCVCFVLWLLPTLVWAIGLSRTAACIFKAVPFLLFGLPVRWFRDRVQSQADRPLFVRRASFFEYLVTRCVKWAFTNLEPDVGRVFLGPEVARRFLAFRLLRSGYLRYPFHRREVGKGKGFKGVEIRARGGDPDVIIYYIHGGGFKMGCPEFYEEFLLAWLSLLAEAGFANPAVLALDYTLVPAARHPTQAREVAAGYRHALDLVGGDGSKVVLAGDSAGATLALSLVVGVGRAKSPPRTAQVAAYAGTAANGANAKATATAAGPADAALYDDLPSPVLAVLISPWVTLASPLDRTTESDYLDAGQLHLYALQYASSDARLPHEEVSFLSRDDPAAESIVSPGLCRDRAVWARGCRRFFVTYGSDEVFVGAIREFLDYLASETVVRVNRRAESGGVHAWPVAALFLAGSTEERLRGLRAIVDEVVECVRPG